VTETQITSDKNGVQLQFLKGVTKKGIIIILLLAGVSVIFEWKKLPLGILCGGVFGLLNLKGLVRGVEGLLCTEKATAKIVFLSMSRLFALSVAIFILIYFKIINVFGLLLGFTAVFILILIEGMSVAKEA